MVPGGDRAAEPAGGSADTGALLWALHRIARLVPSEREPAQILQTALEELCGACGFDVGHVLVSRAGGLETLGPFHGAAGLREKLQFQLASGQSLAGRAVARRSVAWGADFSGDPRAAALAAAGLRSAVACPMWHGARTVGALEFFARFGHQPDSPALAAVEQAAVVLTPVVEHALANGELAELPSADASTWHADDRFRAVFEGAGVGLALGTPDGRLVHVNRGYADFLGYAPRELSGVNVRELVGPEHVPTTLRTLRELESRRTERVDLERQYVRRDGTRVWGRTTVTRLPDTNLLIAVVQDIDARKRAEDAVRRLSGRLLQLQDEERRRIARSLHESAAQTLAALSINLARMERMALPPHAAETLKDSLELATQTSREIRTLSHLLHPPLLEEAGLPSSLRWYVQGFGQRSNVTVSLEIADDLGRLSTELEITLFRIVQEGLTNVLRHSGSPSASVRLRRSGPDVVLEVEDRGIGIPADVLERLRTESSPSVGVGIAGMQERLSQLGGTLEISPSTPGTLVRATIRSGE